MCVCVYTIVSLIVCVDAASDNSLYNETIDRRQQLSQGTQEYIPSDMDQDESIQDETDSDLSNESDDSYNQQADLESINNINKKNMNESHLKVSSQDDFIAVDVNNETDIKYLNELREEQRIEQENDSSIDIDDDDFDSPIIGPIKTASQPVTTKLKKNTTKNTKKK